MEGSGTLTKPHHRFALTRKGDIAELAVAFMGLWDYTGAK